MKAIEITVIKNLENSSQHWKCEISLEIKTSWPIFTETNVFLKVFKQTQ